jgi:ring-1,2-phenylacetyl-CoA epoxidase subunit PaaB
VKRGAESDVYEVFARFGAQSEPIRWVGNVRAGDPELAWHAAREIYTRREDCILLWVSLRSSMVFSEPEDVDLLQASKRLDYRLPGFPGRHRRDRVKAAEVAHEA